MKEKMNGIIRIADDVVAVIAGIATVDTDGVFAMSSGITEDIAKRISRRHAFKGVEVTVHQHTATIDLKIIVHYDKKIDLVCREIQHNVKEAVENMTGLIVDMVNVRVEGIQVATEKAAELSYS